MGYKKNPAMNINVTWNITYNQKHLEYNQNQGPFFHCSRSLQANKHVLWLGSLVKMIW